MPKTSPKLPARRNLVTQQEAEEILAPYSDGLKADFWQSWQWVQDILDQDPERRATLDPSTVAAMIFNRFVVLAIRRLTSDKNVVIRKHGRMMKVTFADKLSLRFKKFDENLCGSNVHTINQMFIYWQMEFDGMDSPTEVTFGYTVDASGRRVTGLYVTCPIGWKENIWKITLDEDRGEDRGDVLPFAAPDSPAPRSPALPAEPAPGTAQVVVTAKEQKKAEGK
jgi:hypothetical protein